MDSWIQLQNSETRIAIYKSPRGKQGALKLPEPIRPKGGTAIEEMLEKSAMHARVNFLYYMDHSYHSFLEIKSEK